MVIVTCVHGTWARGSRWPELEKSVIEALDERGPVEFRYFEWSGRNSVRARTQAAADLRRFLLQALFRSPGARHLVIAHSHGANIALHALDGAERRISDALAGIVLLSPPLLNCKLIDNPESAANRLLLGALAVVPLFFIGTAYAAAALGFSRATALLGMLLVSVLWGGLFRPTRVRQRAEHLVRQLALPHLDFPGLVIRSSRDEATAALTSVGAFARLARYGWSRILRLRVPFSREVQRSLRESRGFGDVAVAMLQALVLVPISVRLVWRVREIAERGDWLWLIPALPIAAMVVTAVLVMVGGAVLLLLLLPVFSFLLWPFGILPTTAAALLTVSVEPVPAPGWHVVHLPDRGLPPGARWKHSTHKDDAALDAVWTYLRGVRCHG